MALPAVIEEEYQEKKLSEIGPSKTFSKKSTKIASTVPLEPVNATMAKELSRTSTTRRKDSFKKSKRSPSVETPPAQALKRTHDLSSTQRSAAMMTSMGP